MNENPTKAAECNNAYAMCQLGFIYSIGGEDLPKNLVEAERLFKEADALGHTDAKRYLDEVRHQAAIEVRSLAAC